MSTSPSRRDLFAELVAFCLALFGVRRATAMKGSASPKITGIAVAPLPPLNICTVYDHANRLICEKVTYSSVHSATPSTDTLVSFTYDLGAPSALSVPSSGPVVSMSYDILDRRDANERPEQA